MDGTGKMLTTFAAQFSTYRPVRVISYPTDQALGYEDLIALVVSMAPKDSFVIVGESFSGPIAIEVAATLRNVVGLVLASSFARHPAPSFLTPMARIVDLAWIPNSMIVAGLLGSAATPELADRRGRVLAGLPREVIRRRTIEVLQSTSEIGFARFIAPSCVCMDDSIAWSTKEW